jgi:hypothetical protein
LHVLADAAERDVPLVMQLGAMQVVSRGDAMAGQVRARHPEGVDAAADAAVLDQRVLPAVKNEGAVATFRGWKGQGERGIRVQPVWVAHYASNHEALDRLRGQVENGQLTLRVADVLHASEAARAHELLAGGGIRGRLVLTWD